MMIKMECTKDRLRLDFGCDDGKIELSHADALELTSDILKALSTGARMRSKDKDMSSALESLLKGFMAETLVKRKQKKEEEAEKDEPADVVKTFYGTFADDHDLKGHYIEIKARNIGQANHNMRKIFGKEWAQVYASMDDAKIEEFDLKLYPDIKDLETQNSG